MHTIQWKKQTKTGRDYDITIRWIRWGRIQASAIKVKESQKALYKSKGYKSQWIY